MAGTPIEVSAIEEEASAAEKETGMVEEEPGATKWGR